MLQLQKCCPHLKFMNGGVSMKSGGSGGGVSIVHLPEEGAQHHISWFALMLGDKIWLSPSLRCAYMHDDDACPHGNPLLTIKLLVRKPFASCFHFGNEKRAVTLVVVKVSRYVGDNSKVPLRTPPAPRYST